MANGKKPNAAQKKASSSKALKASSPSSGKKNRSPKVPSPKKKAISKKGLGVGIISTIALSNEVLDFFEKAYEGVIAIASSEPVRSAIDYLSTLLQSAQFFATTLPSLEDSNLKRASAQLDEIIDLAQRQKAVLSTIEVLVRLLPVVHASLKNVKPDEVVRVNELVALAIKRGVEGGAKSMDQIVSSNLELIIFDLAVTTSKTRSSSIAPRQRI